MIERCTDCHTTYPYGNQCPNCPNKRFGAIAIEKNLLTRHQLDELLKVQLQRKPRLPVGQLLIDNGCLSLAQVAEILGEQELTVCVCTQCHQYFNYRNLPEHKAIATLQCPACLANNAIAMLKPDASLAGYTFGGYFIKSYTRQSPQFHPTPKQVITKDGVGPGNDQESSAPAGLRASLAAGELFAHYQIQQELGRGGMGVVYQALDTQLQRTVALKLILPKQEVSDKEIAMLMQEARTTARLQHENIVQIYEVGELPQNYYTMEFVDGQSLQALIRNDKVGMRELAAILQKCAQALHVAHDKGIVHRDIKSANIMLNSQGQPKVMDFGLAIQSEVKTGLSQAGVGTPAYMPPEQARGEKADCRSDVYSLGATLYEGLAGRPPFQGNIDQVIVQVLHQDPISLRQLNPDIPIELDAICLKCLEKSRDRRYPTAAALAKDLQNFQENRPIQARPINALRLMQKWITRNKTVAMAVSFVFLSLLIGGIVATVQWQKAERTRQNEAREKREAQHQFGTALLEKAKSYQRENLHFEAKMTACRAIGFTGFGGPVAQYPPLLKQGSEEWKESEALIRLAPRFRMLWQSPAISHHDSSVTSVSFSPDGRTLASGSYDNTIRLWDVVTGQSTSTLPGHASAVHSVNFSPDGKTLASGSFDRTIRLWNVATGQTASTLSGHASAVHSVNFSPDGKTLASGSDDGTIWLWNVATGQTTSTLPGHASAVCSVSFSPDGKTLASGSDDKTIRLWDVATGQTIFTLLGHSWRVASVSFSPDGRTLASGSDDNTIRLWDVATGQAIATLTGHSRAVACVSFSPDGKTLASGSFDKTVRLWDAATDQATSTLTGHSRDVASVSFSPDGKTIASGSYDKTVRLWDVTTGRTISTLPGHSDRVWSVSFSPDGKTLASGSGEKTIRLWNVATGQAIFTLPGHSAVWNVSFSPDGKTLASGSDDGTIRLWDVATGHAASTLPGHSGDVVSVSFSPDGKTLAFGNDKTVKLCDVATGQTILTLSGHSDAVFSVSFSPDGKMLVSGGCDKTIRLWDVATGQTILTLPGHSDAVVSVSFSPDGKTLVFGNAKTVKLWDIATGQTISTFPGHSDVVYSVSFSPDGKTLVSGSKDTTVKLWDVEVCLVTIPYLQYLTACEWQKLDMVWKPVARNIQTAATLWFPIPQSSHISILQSRLTDEVKDRLLCSRYLAVNNLESAFCIGQKLAKTPDNERLRQVLAQSLLDSSKQYSVAKADRMAERRQSQAKIIQGDIPSVRDGAIAEKPPGNG